MRVFELDRDGGLLLAAIRARRATEPARDGLHVSTICDDWLLTAYPSIARRRQSSQIDEHQTFAFQEIGNVLEDVIARQLRRRVLGWIRPKPRMDAYGIIGSPDGWRPLTKTIDEVKVAWASARGFVRLSKSGRLLEGSPKFTRYAMQGIKYADMWEADRLCLHVCFLNGNYRPVFPQFRTFTIPLTAKDKLHNSETLWQHAADRGWLPQYESEAA